MDGFFGLVPIGIFPDVLTRVVRIAQADLSDEIFELQRAEDVQNEVDDLSHLLFHLVDGAENVRVVLGEASNASQTVQLTGLLVPVNRAELRKPNGQVTVTAGTRFENLAVMRAIHRLQQVLLAFCRGIDGLETVLPVLGIVTTGDVQLFVADVRCDDAFVPGFALGLFQKGFEPHPKIGTFRQPQRQTLTHLFGEVEQVHLLAQLSVVTSLGLLEQFEVFLQLLLFRERDPVHAGQLLLGFVAFPVGTRNGHHFTRLDKTRVGHVWPAA